MSSRMISSNPPKTPVLSMKSRKRGKGAAILKERGEGGGVSGGGDTRGGRINLECVGINEPAPARGGEGVPSLPREEGERGRKWELPRCISADAPCILYRTLPLFERRKRTLARRSVFSRKEGKRRGGRENQSLTVLPVFA